MLPVPVLPLVNLPEGHTITKTLLVGTPPKADKFGESLSRKFALQEGARRLAGSKALDGCFRRRQFGHDALEAVYYPSRDTAGLKHVQTCGSRWACPVCASLLSELSRRELEAAIAEHEFAGGGIVMGTFTVPHYQNQSCPMVLGSQQKWLKFEKGTPVEDRTPNPLYGGLKEALHLFAGDRDGKALYTDIGIVGTVRNLEVTLGDNGWHCHSHAIWFTEKPLNAQELKQAHKAARLRWVSCIIKAGLPSKNLNALLKHSFRLTTDKEYIQDYVVKMGKETDWHIEQELSKNAVKLGKHGGRTPMQLLADYTFDGDELAGEKWAEYAATYRGSKQLYWSKGLRGRLLGSEREYTDAELMGIAETGQLPEWARPPEHVVIETPTDREWARICADGVRGYFLSLVRDAGKTGDRTRFEEWYKPYRVYERGTPLVTQHWKEVGPPDDKEVIFYDVEPHPLKTISHDSFEVIDFWADERDKGQSLADKFRSLPDPLLSDPEAVAALGLTPWNVQHFRQMHAQYQAEEGRGLEFFEARALEREWNQVDSDPAIDILAGVYLAAGGRGKLVGRVLSNDGMGTIIEPGQWTQPGRLAVLRLLTFALRLAPGLEWEDEEKPPASVEVAAVKPAPVVDAGPVTLAVRYGRRILHKVISSPMARIAGE